MKKTNINVTLWANRIVAVCVALLMFTLPMILDWYCRFRMLYEIERLALTVAFYCCAAVVFPALWNIDALLRSIRAGDVFIKENVRRIGMIQWCCGGVALICIPATLCYYPLVFMAVVMGFLCLVVSVLRQVMDAAVAIREENDLTV